MTTAPYSVAPFPPPPEAVSEAISALHVISLRPPTDDLSLRQAASLPRPWDPATCSSDLQAELWPWIDDVVEWINREQIWGLASTEIPDCWPYHRHLCHELPALACDRYLAGFAITPRDVEDWREIRLGVFLDRMQRQVGHLCAPDQHRDDPRYRGRLAP